MNNVHGLQKVFCTTKKKIKKRLPTILTCIGTAGVVATVLMAVKATPKAVILLDKAKKEKKELSILETTKIIIPPYIPTILAGITTISCIVGANILSKKRQMSIVGAYTMLDQSYKRYKKAANDVFGNDADSKIKAEMAKNTFIYGAFSGEGQLYDPTEDSSDKVLFYDSYSERFFHSTLAAVINAEYHFNRNLSIRGYMSLNDFYEFLGLDKIAIGDDIGWYMDKICEGGYMWMDFENEYIELEENGLYCYRISTLFDPTPEDMDE